MRCLLIPLMKWPLLWHATTMEVGFPIQLISFSLVHYSVQLYHQQQVLITFNNNNIFKGTVYIYNTFNNFYSGLLINSLKYLILWSILLMKEDIVHFLRCRNLDSLVMDTSFINFNCCVQWMPYYLNTGRYNNIMYQYRLVTR